MAAKSRRNAGRSKLPAQKPPRRPVGKAAPRTPPRKPLVKQLPVSEPLRVLPAEMPVHPDEAAASAAGESSIFPIEIDTTEIEETLKTVGKELKHWANKGRYTKVRFKFRGKQLLPDLPLAAVVAAEGLSFYWGGILRALLVTFGVNSVLQVELVNDSEKKVQLGREELLSGELEKAKELFEQALKMNRDSASAHLNLGIVFKLKGDAVKARQEFERAKALDTTGATGLEAEKLLAGMPPVPPPSGAV